MLGPSEQGETMPLQHEAKGGSSSSGGSSSGVGIEVSGVDNSSRKQHQRSRFESMTKCKIVVRKKGGKNFSFVLSTIAGLYTCLRLA